MTGHATKHAKSNGFLLAPTLSQKVGAAPSGTFRHDGPKPPEHLLYQPDWARIARRTVVQPGTRVRLDEGVFDSSYVDSDIQKDKGVGAIDAAKSELFTWQDKFFAQADRSLLVVLQGIDAAGKDSTIKRVMSGVNPSGITVHSFKAPGSLERAHNYLWRHNLALPSLGGITIFNRSHYENVLVTRVHPEILWPKTAVAAGDDIWERRFRQINEWERQLTEDGTVIVKLFLNLSRAEQGKRFLERREDPAKNWKISEADMAERAHWDEYTHAYEEMLSHTSTPWAPWHVIPSDKKWFSQVSTFSVLLETMRVLAPQYPEVDEALKATIAQEIIDLQSGK